MNEQSAIKFIDRAADDLERIPKELNNMERLTLSAYHVAIRSLLKQIPQEAEVKKSLFHPGFVCPKCRHTFAEYEVGTDYCCKCGQRISWRIENE